MHNCPLRFSYQSCNVESRICLNEIHPWLLIRTFPRPARGWSHFLRSPGSTFRVQHFRIWRGRDQASRGPDVGLSSGALRAPELKIASRTPARASRAPAPTKDFFFIFVKIFLSFGFRFLVIFLRFRAISGSEISYSAFSYCVSWVYATIFK